MHTDHHSPYTNYVRVSPQADSVCCWVCHCVHLCFKENTLIVTGSCRYIAYLHWPKAEVKKVVIAAKDSWGC